MQDLERDGPTREVATLRKQEETRSMQAIIMAGIAGLMIIAGIAAYNYATDDEVAMNAPAPATATNPATRTAPETTGSGGSLRPEQQTPDRSITRQ